MTTDMSQHKGVENKLTHNLDGAFSRPCGGRRTFAMKELRAALSRAARGPLSPRGLGFQWDLNISVPCKTLHRGFKMFPAELMF